MWTMTEDMRRIAEQRIIADKVTVASTAEMKTGIWHGLKLSLADYRLWIIVLINITISAAYGFSNFYPAIVRGFGFERTITLVITFPPYFFAAGLAVAIAWSSDKASCERMALFDPDCCRYGRLHRLHGHDAVSSALRYVLPVHRRSLWRQPAHQHLDHKYASSQPGEEGYLHRRQ